MSSMGKRGAGSNGDKTGGHPAGGDERRVEARHSTPQASASANRPVSEQVRPGCGCLHAWLQPKTYYLDVTMDDPFLVQMEHALNHVARGH